VCFAYNYNYIYTLTIKIGQTTSRYLPPALTVENFNEKMQEFLSNLVSIIEFEKIPPELVLNWDQTGIKVGAISIFDNAREGI